MTIDGSDSRTDRVAEVFHRALELPPDEVGSFLDETCAGDEGLRDEIEALLRSDDDAPDGFLPGSRRRSPTGTRVGSYEILECLGEGGMGTVYAARQDFPRREVALKLIRSGRLSAEASQRFEKEVHALGSLHHPGIAQIFDAGTALVGAPGRGTREEPFLAMELVRGKPLLDYAEAKGLGTRERLELVARVADAVHHAHQRGVIHRDLKPENVLVTDDETRADSAPETWSGVGQPKVLDFGIARIAGDVGSAVTRAGELIGTLSYMSPEQIEGDSRRVDERSDVYALGVLCYQLLASALPHDFSGMSVPEAVRAMRTRHPVPLSERDARLRGDVSTIVGRALDGDRDRRYPSAAALADDLRRHLRGAPIRARSDSTLYVLRRGLLRHRIALGLVVAFLLVGVALAMQWRDRQALALESDEQFEKALESIAMFEQFGGEHFHQSPEEREVLEAVLVQQERLLKGREEDPRGRIAQAKTRVRVDVLRSILGEADASESLQVAVQDLEELRGSVAGVDEVLAKALREVASHQQNVGELDRAEESLLHALELEGLAQTERARVMVRLGHLNQGRGRFDAALDLWCEALAALDSPKLEHDALAERTRWECLNAIGTVQAELGRLDESARTFAAFEERLSRVDSTNDPIVKSAVIDLTNNLSTLAFRRGDTTGVGPRMERAARMAEELVEQFPRNTYYRRIAMGTFLNLGAHQANQGLFEEARLSMLRAEELSAELVRQAPDDVELQGLRGLLLANLGKLGSDLGEFEQALSRIDEAITLLVPATMAFPGKSSWRAHLQEARLYRPYCLVRTGRHAEGVNAVPVVALDLADPDGLQMLEVFSQAVDAVEGDESLSSEDRAAAREAYIELAIQHVSRHLDAGFEDVSALHDDTLYAGLLAEPTFQSFLELLEN